VMKCGDMTPDDQTPGLEGATILLSADQRLCDPHLDWSDARHHRTGAGLSPWSPPEPRGPTCTAPRAIGAPVRHRPDASKAVRQHCGPSSGDPARALRQPRTAFPGRLGGAAIRAARSSGPGPRFKGLIRSRPARPPCAAFEVSAGGPSGPDSKGTIPPGAPSSGTHRTRRPFDLASPRPKGPTLRCMAGIRWRRLLKINALLLNLCLRT